MDETTGRTDEDRLLAATGSTMSEPLLRRSSGVRRGEDFPLDNDHSDGEGGELTRKHWKIPSKIIYPVFLGMGFLFGFGAECIYIAGIKAGQVKLMKTREDTYTVQVHSIRDLLYYELSYLGSDVLFLIYIVVLLRAVYQWRHAKALKLDIAAKASNWTVGMILGLVFAICRVIGLKKLIASHIGQVGVSISIGVLLCFVAYAMAAELNSQRILRHRCQSEAKNHKEPPTPSTNLSTGNYCVAQIV